MDADANDQDIELENRGRRHESTSSSDDPPPPLGVKLTGYRLLNISVVLGFITVKVILARMGRPVMSTVDLSLGGFLWFCLYWIGLYETECSKKWPKWEWFFQVDLMHAIRYAILRFMGGFLGVLFAIQGTLAITSLTSIPVFLFAHFRPGVSLDLWLGIYVVLTICVQLIWLRTRRVRRRLRIRQGVVGFVEAYGLSASLPEEHEWSGTVGITLGFYFGMALVCSPLAVVHFSL